LPGSTSGGALWATIGCVALVAALVALTIPGVERSRVRLQRQLCIESLARVAAAKENLTVIKGLKIGAPVTMGQLVKESQLLKSAPLFPEGMNMNKDVRVNPIGEPPTCVFRGETLTPLSDYPLYQKEVNSR
jgi:hypothetical protein